MPKPGFRASVGGRLPTRANTGGPFKVHVVPFKDNAGNDAVMAYDFPETHSLPPLFSYSVYITTADASPGTTNITRFFRALVPNGPAGSPCRFRMDIYFIPGASHEACMQHYLAEFAKRGDLIVQAKSGATGTGRLPGMVPSYVVNELCYYHRLLWWKGDSTPADYVLQISFEPTDDEKLIQSLNGEGDEPYELPPVQICEQEINVDDSLPPKGPGQSVEDCMNFLESGQMRWWYDDGHMVDVPLHRGYKEGKTTW